MADRYQELTALLRSLNLSRMAASFEDVAVHAVRNGRSHETFLYELARLECEHRAQPAGAAGAGVGLAAGEDLPPAPA